MIVLQALAVMAFLFGPAISGELAWRWLRSRPPRRRRLVGVGAGVALVLEAAAVAVGFANSTLGGYLLFGVGVVTIVILMTAYLTWWFGRIAKQ